MKINRKKIMWSAVIFASVLFIFSFKIDLFRISKNIEIFLSIYKEVNEKYVDDIPSYQLMETGIDAMLNSLDPYTEYFAESEMGDYKMQYINDSYGGIGATTFLRDNKLFLGEVFEKSPSQKAGLRPGDQITSIDKIEVNEDNLLNISEKLKGGRSTQIELKIKRGNEELFFSFKRDKIRLPSVSYADLLEDKIAYIKLNRFVESSTDEIKAKIKELKKKNPEGVILDLRNNGGGLLNEAVKIVNLFVPPGELVVSQQGKDPKHYFEHKTLNSPFDAKIPLVILINRNSASASEVVSGALQDLDRAVIIGQKSFGKALVQQTIDLPYNSLLKITVAKYYTPSGRCLQSIDYFNRNLDGSAKNIDKQLVKPYYTKNKREIYNAGSVAPDIEANYEKTIEAIDILYKHFIMFDFSNDYRNRVDSIAAIDKFVFSDEDYNDFKKYVLQKEDIILNNKVFQTLKRLKESLAASDLYEHLKDEYEIIHKKVIEQNSFLLDKHKEEVIKEIKLNIFEKYYFERGRTEYILSFDPFVKKAIKVLQDSTQYTSILMGEKHYKLIGKTNSEAENDKN